ncbi:MAG: hypothetical protein JNM75_02835 [Rhodospirillales bacterium]|nr:hypothetical protein [Rhodospirillales bacterium]
MILHEISLKNNGGATRGMVARGFDAGFPENIQVIGIFTFEAPGVKAARIFGRRSASFARRPATR